MAKIISFTDTRGLTVAIPANKITGFTESSNPAYGQCFIATGADGADGGENGWYVKESYREVWVTLESVLNNDE